MIRTLNSTDSLWVNSSVTQIAYGLTALSHSLSLAFLRWFGVWGVGVSAWVSVGGGGVGCCVNPFTAMMLLENEQCVQNLKSFILSLFKIFLFKFYFN